MKITLNEPPRKFKVGKSQKIELSDCGQVSLQADEQVTFVTESKTQYDVARKSWGYYATPSLNGRLPQFGLRPALILNKSSERFFVALVEKTHIQEFERYLLDEELTLLYWLDQPEALKKLENLKS
jgi:hypothetical protein